MSFVGVSLVDDGLGALVHGVSSLVGGSSGGGDGGDYGGSDHGGGLSGERGGGNHGGGSGVGEALVVLVTTEGAEARRASSAYAQGKYLRNKLKLLVS